MKYPIVKNSVLTLTGIFILFTLFALLSMPTASAADNGVLLWEIGKADQNYAEFALAPNGYSQFKQDGFFIVGRSESAKDWPFIHPGPNDRWAGNRQHTFSVLFGLKNQPKQGQYKLLIHVLDTQHQTGPKLDIQVNGHTYSKSLAAGFGDETLNGKPELGKAQTVEMDIPADQLQQGENTLTFTTQTGSWMLYDSIRFLAPTGVELAEVKGQTFVLACDPVRALLKKDGQFYQPVRLNLHHSGDAVEAVILASGKEIAQVQLKPGSQFIEAFVPAVEREESLDIALAAGGKTLAVRSITVKPVRKMTIYILPHSHTDIGYTDIQTAIEEKQMKNLETGIEYARKTQHYPEGSRFVWNVEVLWAADLYLNRMNEAQRADFLDAVKKGWVGLNGMYLNELTGLCRPEELLQLFRYSIQLAELCGVTIDSVMISDVPGYTWGTVPAMLEAGLKYFSTAPNYFDRIGDILVKWENRPFYWVAPSGKEKVLVWIPYKGYALSHTMEHPTPQFVETLMEQLEKIDYPYDIAYSRWSGHGDNAVPDLEIADFIKEWNTKYAYPKFIITTTSEAFQAFEKKYGGQLPEVRGDWTPYWEDGAGSSALETAMNRASSDRITQAETLWAMLNPSQYPVKKFEEAWRNVLLYSEHTWGAWCSVSDPENKMTREQWDIKQSYALEADKQTRDLFNAALKNHNGSESKSKVDVINTNSWQRSDLVVLSKELSSAGDRILDDAGTPVPSQRLSGGELVFYAQSVPALGMKRYSITDGLAYPKDSVTVQDNVLDNGILRLRVDEKTGGILDLQAKGFDGNFVDTASGYAMNEYVFLEGDNLANLQRNGAVKISIKEKGPLVASLLIESEAPGCNALRREVRLSAGADYVELINVVDKKRAAVSPKPGDGQFAQKGGKESVNFAFPFKVPNGVLRLDLPLGVIEPEKDQMPSACKNWFTVGRWADVSSESQGITWVTLDAPLVEVGEISATLLGSQANPDVWRKHVEPTQKLFSWAMNNHWGTNYRAYQEGPVTFRYALRPHRGYEPDAATRFATGLSQPLIAAPALGDSIAVPRLQIKPEGATAIALKPSDDGKAWIVKLYGASGKDIQAQLLWCDPAPKSIWLSDTSEKPLKKLDGPVSLPAWDVVTLRAE